MTDPEPLEPDSSRWKEPTFWFAAIIIVAFAGLTLYLIRQAGLPELQWTRLIYVYGGVEAIVFAAAGYIFGREVHRERAEVAEELASDAARELRTANEARLRAEQQEAEVQAKAEALQSVARAEQASAAIESRNGEADAQARIDAAALNRIVAVADDLFR